MLCDLNRLYCSESALYDGDVQSEGFRWVVGDDSQNSVTAFLRQTRDLSETILVVMNLTPTPRDNYVIGVPMPGYYRELFNSDATYYGGGGIGNQGGVYSSAFPNHGMNDSVQVTVPPLSVSMFRAVPGPPPESGSKPASGPQGAEKK